MMDTLLHLLPLAYTNAIVAVGAALLGATSGLLGSFAVLRQRTLVGDALAHAALPGICIAFLITGAKNPGTLLVGAGVAGIIGAFLMLFIERSKRIKPDSAIGVVLSSFFSLGIVLLTFINHQANANQAGLDRYLFGQAAGLLANDIITMLALIIPSFLLVIVFYKPLKVTLFDRNFASSIGVPVKALELMMTFLLVIAVIIGLRMVGAILMVALIVVPATAARQLTNRLSILLPLAGAIGAGVGITGALLSEKTALPTGPVIVLVGFIFVTFILMFSPHKGLLWRLWNLSKSRQRRLTESILVDLDTSLQSGPPPTFNQFLLITTHHRHQALQALKNLEKAGLINSEGGRYYLSEAGSAAVKVILERRKLWTAWLEHGWQLQLPDAREPNPSDIRTSLGDSVADQLLTLQRSSR